MNLSNKNKDLEEAAEKILLGKAKLKNESNNIDESIELDEAAKRNPIEDWIHLRHNDVRTFLDNLKPMLKLVKSASDEAVSRTLDGISSKYNEYLSDMIWDYFWEKGAAMTPLAVKASLITFKRDVSRYLSSEKGAKADDILDAFDDFRINLKKNMRRFKEHIEEAKSGNDKQYKWGDINKALMSAGFGPKVIVQVMMKLKGKEIKEELEEATNPKTKQNAVKAIETAINDVEAIMDQTGYNARNSIGEWQEQMGDDFIDGEMIPLLKQHFKAR